MDAPKTKYKAAVVQAAPVYFNLEAMIDKTIGFMERAAGDGAELVGFAENWISGYPFWIWLGSPFWAMRFLKPYHDNALAVDSAEMERLREAAKRLGIHVAFGFTEKAGGSLYMAQSLIDDQGRLVFTRRKLKPTHMERTLFGEGDGSDLRVAETALGRIGALCCWEHIQPLSKYALYSMNEQVHLSSWPSFCIPTEMAHALGADVNHAASRVYAVEGQCYVLAPCSVVTQEAIDLFCDTPDKAEILTKGGGVSQIYAPDGQALCTPLGPEEEGLLFAEIDLDMITYAKAVADPVGHYARPDVTRLLFDPRPKSPVERVAPEPSVLAQPAETANDEPEPAGSA